MACRGARCARRGSGRAWRLWPGSSHRAPNLVVHACAIVVVGLRCVERGGVMSALTGAWGAAWRNSPRPASLAHGHSPPAHRRIVVGGVRVGAAAVHALGRVVDVSQRVVVVGSWVLARYQVVGAHPRPGDEVNIGLRRSCGGGNGPGSERHSGGTGVSRGGQRSRPRPCTPRARANQTVHGGLPPHQTGSWSPTGRCSSKQAGKRTTSCR